MIEFENTTKIGLHIYGIHTAFSLLTVIEFEKVKMVSRAAYVRGHPNRNRNRNRAFHTIYISNEQRPQVQVGSRDELPRLDNVCSHFSLFSLSPILMLVIFLSIDQ